MTWGPTCGPLSADHHPPCHARHRLRLHRGVHADPGQLPDPQPDGRQELPVVHRTDLQPVYRQLQLEPGQRLSASFLLVLSSRSSGLAETDPPESSARWCNDPFAAHYATLYAWASSSYVAIFFMFLFAPLLVTCVLAFNDSQFPALPWKGFTLEWFTAHLPERVGIFHDTHQSFSIWVSCQGWPFS
jgi:hypothetical protein